jgi:hypothetical protein
MNIGMNDRLFQLAVNAAGEGNYIQFDDISIAGDMVESDNPETIFLSNERRSMIQKTYDSLTDEAKQIIDIIFDAPNEMLELIGSPKTKKISKGRIATMLYKQWGDRKTAKEVMKELSNFARTF